MPSSFIPQRVKRAKQQITVKLYQDQLAMLDKYGRFIDDSRDYIISQASNWYSNGTKNLLAGSSRREMLAAMRNAPSPALNLLVQHHPLDHSGMREESVLAQKSWARCKQNQHRPSGDSLDRGKLPPVEVFGARLLGFDSSRTRRSTGPAPLRPLFPLRGSPSMSSDGLESPSCRRVLRQAQRGYTKTGAFLGSLHIMFTEQRSRWFLLLRRPRRSPAQRWE